MRYFGGVLTPQTETFAKGDYLVCVVRMDQWLTPSGLRTEYVVENVVKHLERRLGRTN